MPCSLDDLLIQVSLTKAIQRALPLLSAPAGASTPRPSHFFFFHTNMNLCIHTTSSPLWLLEILHWPRDRPNEYLTATVKKLGRWAFFHLSLEDQYLVWFICPSGFVTDVFWFLARHREGSSSLGAGSRDYRGSPGHEGRACLTPQPGEAGGTRAVPALGIRYLPSSGTAKAGPGLDSMGRLSRAVESWRPAQLRQH